MNLEQGFVGILGSGKGDTTISANQLVKRLALYNVSTTNPKLSGKLFRAFLTSNCAYKQDEKAIKQK